MTGWTYSLSEAAAIIGKDLDALSRWLGLGCPAMTQADRRKPLSQSIADAIGVIDCVAQREAYRRATELIGPGLERITGRMPAGTLDGWTTQVTEPA